MIDIAVGIDGFNDPRDVVRVAAVADRVGVANLWLTESRGRDAFTLLGLIAAQTERIGLGTGIVNIFGRTPSQIAQSTATVMELMGERTFNLGLGASGKASIEKFHGVPFSKPMSRMEEYVRILDHIFSNGTVPPPGEMFTTQHIRVDFTVPERSRLKIFVAGLTPRTIAITGAYADGWLPIWPSRSRGVEGLDTLLSTAAEAGRPVPEVAVYIYGVISDDPEMIQRVRGTIAFYLSANGTAYRNMFHRMGYGEEADAVAEMWQSGRRDEARRMVDQAMFEDITLYGDLPQFLSGLEQFRAAGVQRPVLRIPNGASAEEAVSMIGRLADA